MCAILVCQRPHVTLGEPLPGSKSGRARTALDALLEFRMKLTERLVQIFKSASPRTNDFKITAAVQHNSW